MIYEEEIKKDEQPQPVKKKRGRPRTRPISVYMTPGEIEVVDRFLSVRLEQARAAAEAFRAGMPDRGGLWSEAQLAYLVRVASTIAYLQSTLDDPIAWEMPETHEG
jgi:hypothetical protein